MTKTAVFVKDVSEMFSDVAKVYKMSPPHEGYRYVVSSAADFPFSGVETYLFGCDKEGSVSSWAELEGSMKGVFNCDAAIENAGYVVKTS